MRSIDPERGTRGCGALILALLVNLLADGRVHAAVGWMTLEGPGAGRPVTVFYPSDAPTQDIQRRGLRLHVAPQGKPVHGNGRLVVLSHGSGGSPWMYMDLASSLVQAGFVVAVPEHQGDNHREGGEPGPPSWKRRPTEVSAAIDAVGEDARLAPMLKLDKVGMYGMSAGGHTALSLAGGRWSPIRFKQHCDAHIGEDFQTCVGLITHLTGGVMDGVKKAVALWVIDARFDDAKWYSHTEPRIAALVAGVPLAADFDPASLAAPRVPLGLVTARSDRWLMPRFHSDAVLAACRTCERVGDFPEGGHGALLSPLPPDLSGLALDILGDPAGFDRATEVPRVNRSITDFFLKHLTH